MTFYNVLAKYIAETDHNPPKQKHHFDKEEYIFGKDLKYLKAVLKCPPSYCIYS